LATRVIVEGLCEIQPRGQEQLRFQGQWCVNTLDALPQRQRRQIPTVFEEKPWPNSAKPFTADFVARRLREDENEIHQ
jgi:hypothetical protein